VLRFITNQIEIYINELIHHKSDVFNIQNKYVFLPACLILEYQCKHFFVSNTAELESICYSMFSNDVRYSYVLDYDNSFLDEQLINNMGNLKIKERLQNEIETQIFDI